MKEAKALTPGYLMSMVKYMSGAKSTIAGPKQICKDHRKMMFWRRHIMYPDNGNVVFESRSMHLLKKRSRALRTAHLRLYTCACLCVCVCPCEFVWHAIGSFPYVSSQCGLSRSIFLIF